MKQSSLLIETNHFTAGSKTRVNGLGPLLAYRRCQQKLSEILSKHLHRLKISPLFGNLHSLILNGRMKQPLIGITNSILQLLIELERTAFLAFIE